MINQIPWTPQQLAFFDRLRTTDDSIILTAVAGSGKTTTLVEGVKHLRGSILAIAFNVKIKKTLEDRIGDLAVCKTINGLGHSALIKFFGHRFEIDRDKIRKISTELLKRPENKHMWLAWTPIIQLVARAKNHGLVPKKSPGLFKPLLEDTLENWEDLAAHYDLAFNSEIHRLAWEILNESISWSFNKNICDFDDQIYLSCCWGAPFNKFDNVLVDEAQDLSEIQHAIVRKALRKSGRLIAVGDPNQAIYGWRGAKDNSIEQLVTTFGLSRLDLTVSFRCAKAIVAEAQKVIPRIESSESAPEGYVHSWDTYPSNDFRAGDVILCRNNAPIIKLAYRLIGSGWGVTVVGRDIGRGLIILIKDLVGKKSDDIPIETLSEALYEWKSRELVKAEKQGKWSKAQTINDKAESLRVVVDRPGIKLVGEAIEAINELFRRKDAKIILSTIHRAKGMEWDRVFLLDQQLMPSRWAVKSGMDWMLQEEQNLRYVAITRAKQDLVYIDSNGWEST